MTAASTLHAAMRMVVPKVPEDLGEPARRRHRRETAAWLCLAAALGSIEGGVLGVVAKNAFDGTVPDWQLAIAVAIVSGAPALSNITSFVWAGLAHGRNKVRFLTGLQVATAVLVSSIAFASPAFGSLGLALLVLGGLGGRICWAGVVTLRATVWRANHPRTSRALIAGRIAAFQALMLATASFGIGKAMEIDERAFHVLYPTAAIVAVLGASIYGRTRVRGHRALLDQERANATDGVSPINPARTIGILKEDPAFRGYMGAMFLFGIGNIALMPVLILLITDRFGFGYLAGVMVTATIPVLVMPFMIPVWARLLDRMHILRFRTFHCWAFIATNALILAAAVFHLPWLIFVAAVGRGIAFAGGVLGWNLGHTDFAPPDRTSEYMGVHATLTGVRGLIGPAAAVALYGLFESFGEGGGAGVFAVCLALNFLGAARFLRLARTIDPAASPADGVERAPASPRGAAAGRTTAGRPLPPAALPARRASIPQGSSVQSTIPRSPARPDA